MKVKFKLLFLAIVMTIFLLFGGCASIDRGCKSCSSNMAGGLYRVVNVYSLDGKLIATYEGKIDIDNNTNGSVMFDLDGKRYVYYNAIVEVIEK